MRFLLLMLLLLLPTAPAIAVPPGAEAHYWVQSAGENQDPPIRRVRIAAGEMRNVDGVSCQDWEMSLEKPDGSVLGIQVRSERVPLTSPEGHGRVFRYVFSPDGAESFEYADARSGRALLPEHAMFEPEYLPRAFGDARYSDGFANSGRLIGHALVRSNVRPDFPAVDFGTPKLLRLRSDAIVGPHTNYRNDRDQTIPLDERKYTPYLADDYREMIAAGANYFNPDPANREWLRREPVYCRGEGVHPDDFYRSNYLPGRAYIDEPAVRFGWNEWVPGSAVSPDVYANALQIRVEEAQRPVERTLSAANWFNTGAMNAVSDPIPSWDTYAWTTWYQLAGGAPALVHEGRYRHRGYDWAPEILLGEGLEGLDDRQQYDFFNAFLRGAARRWNGHWGVSVYPEGDVTMMVPAMARAYDSGARYFWMWDDPNLPYRRCVEVVRGLNAHMQAHPRGASDDLRRIADAAVVLPAGYVWNGGGIVGMENNALSPGGASYEGIAASSLFEGIRLSRAGIEYDYVNDYDGLRSAGYRRLVYVNEDGTVRRVPGGGSAVDGLKLSAAIRESDTTQGPPADYTIARAPKLAVDGDLADWAGVHWIDISGQEKHWYGDNYRAELDLVIPEDANPKSKQDYLGFAWDDISDDYRRKYLLEGYGGNQVVVTSVTPGSAAAQAGLREGDVFRYINDKWIRWAFEVWGKVDESKRTPGKSMHIKIQRNGVDNFGGDVDLSGQFAAAFDDENLYLAVDVRDDVHVQNWSGPEFWRNDCVQVGFDPVLARSHGYGELGSEIGFALAGGGPVAWRWAARRGMPVGEMRNARLAAVRSDGRTIYEAAVPLSELSPLAPGLHRRIGMSVTVNDSDDGRSRKARLELARGSMTTGKRLYDFPVFEFAAPAEDTRVSASVTWDRRSMKRGGAAELTVALVSPRTARARIEAVLESLDDPGSAPARSSVDLPVTATPVKHRLSASTLSPAGRYRLTVRVLGPDGRLAAQDSLPVYVYQ